MASYIRGNDNFDSLGTVIGFYKASNATRTSIASTSLVNVTGMSITMTPKSSNSLIVLQAVLPHSHSYVCSFTFLKDNAKIAPATGPNSNEAQTHATMYEGNAAGNMHTQPLFHYETAGNTNSRTYTLAATSGWGGNTYTLYLNGRSSNDMGSSSWMYCWEISQ